ncbi:putative transcription factor FET5 [Moesziomyces antarcticus T-34]|uniref:GPN-loop GTPase 3 n=1 Tax=Pseudozyma antarctica (strain T-34) TaxID=1151754 RepID=M9LM01_PSEA3|nr:putative transcription factor FET5 [Moesziomyces antarcticus T-34]
MLCRSSQPSHGPICRVGVGACGLWQVDVLLRADRPRAIAGPQRAPLQPGSCCGAIRVPAEHRHQGAHLARRRDGRDEPRAQRRSHLLFRVGVILSSLRRYRYLLDNLDWLDDELGEFNDDYIIIDCPGQIELYTHFPIMSRLVNILSVQYNFRICATYLLEAQFMDDKTKYFAGVLSAMSAMINLEVPHINLLSKMDLVEKGEIGAEAKKGRRREMERYLDPDPLLLMDEVNSRTNPKFHSLNQALVQLIDDFSMVSFMPLDSTDEDSVGTILSHIDNAVQYGEDEEPKEPKDMDEGDFQAA